MQPFLVYLSGPITGLTYDGSESWREYVNNALPASIIGISPLRGDRYLNKPGLVITDSEKKEFPLTTDRAINRRDYFDTLRADAVLVNLLGAQRVSIGTCIEIAWAWDHHKPVICAMEPEGNIHDHPMLRDQLSVRVSSLDEAIEMTVAHVMPHERFFSDRINQAHLLQAEGRINTEGIPNVQDIW